MAAAVIINVALPDAAATAQSVTENADALERGK
jgi:hypothetical protein